MSKDKKLGIGLSGISLATAILAGIYLAFTGGSISIAAFAWPALGFILGIGIVFFNFVEVGLQIEDEIEQFPQLVEDDLHQLRSGTITPTHFMVVGTLFAAAIEIGLLLWYEKIYAAWGPFNVLLIALLVVGLASFWSFRSDWFQIRRSRLTTRVFWIPAVGWLICSLIGVTFEEPKEYGGRSQLERSQAVISEENQMPTSPRSSYIFFRTADMAGDAIGSFDCDDEGCLVVLLIIIVAVSVLASATIPHFWVVATMLLLTLMGVIALRELLYTDEEV